MVKFISYGIHTRLYYVIERSGGLDKEVRRKMFENEYGYDKETIDIVLMYDVDKLLKEHTIEEIKQTIIDKRASDRCKGEKSIRALTSVLGIMSHSYMYSNMFRRGDYF